MHCSLSVYFVCLAGTKKRGISPAQRKKLLAAIKERIPGAAS